MLKQRRASVILTLAIVLQATLAPGIALGAGPTPPAPAPAASEPSVAPADRVPPEIAVNSKELKRSCGADYKKLCPDVRMGGGRIVRCLKEHEAELSAPCRQVVAPGAAK